MATVGYGFCLIITVVVLLYMAAKNYENINMYDWTIMLLLPVVILGYWMKSRVTTSEAAGLAFCFIYLDSTLLFMVTLFAMLRSLGIPVKPWIKLAGYGIAMVHVFIVWMCFGTDLYYAEIKVEMTSAGTITRVAEGPFKVIHGWYLAAVLCLFFGVLITSYIKKNTYSRHILYKYSLVSAVFVLVYAVESLADVKFSVLPYLYAAAEIFIAATYDKMHMHDISCIMSQQQKYFSKRGYIVLDMQQRFMSCNDNAYEFKPFLRTQRVDEKLPEEEELFRDMIKRFHQDGCASEKYRVGEMTCICEMAELSLRRDGRVQGYVFDIRDATEEQKAMDVMTSYNETLSTEVEKKTENIIDIQRKITVGMANIIENRDNNTGGHVKRTSDVIKIIVDEIRKNNIMEINPQMAEDIVRAAPMHDLGKIAIDSSVLCKPGRLTDEEYAIMKTHAVKSGEMVHILLDGVEEQHFVDIAFHIARFHHERWDGRGYPDGLVGTMIPVEARVMAVADVYDALVSKRCYKEPMSFDKAKSIMLEGMGTQFDPNLRKIFLNCCDKLEQYYTNAE